MRFRLATLVMGGLAATTLAVSFAAPDAFAAAQHPAAASAHAIARFNPGDGFNLVPSSQGTETVYAATAEGVNAQVQTVATDPTIWNTTAATSGYKIMPNGNSGHCLEQDSNELKIQNCMSGNNQQEWNFTTDSDDDTNISCVCSGQYVGVFNPNTSKPVWVEGKNTGYYVGWQLLPA